MFYSVTAAVIGGTAMLGGSGTILGAFLGAVALSTLIDGFDIVGISANVLPIIFGAAILGRDDRERAAGHGCGRGDDLMTAQAPGTPEAGPAGQLRRTATAHCRAATRCAPSTSASGSAR